jgi:hypothetical protein
MPNFSGVWTLKEHGVAVKGDRWQVYLNNRGLFGGGYTSSIVDTIQYIDITSTGDATDFGNLSGNRYLLAGCSSVERGVFGGGDSSASSRIFGGGDTSGGSGQINVIEYITIASTGDATDFGDLDTARRDLSSCASTTRGVFGGGEVVTTKQNMIDYITIASTGNATDFGDLTVARMYISSSSNSERGLFGGGYTGSNSNVIDYITIASAGNATDFGDLVAATQSPSATSNQLRVVFAGGNSGSVTNVMQFVTIASTGDTTDFGDLTVATTRMNAGTISGAHGGLA